ncbi:MAG: LptE family protein [Acidobacteriota bacterium]|nr:LptE family protein [Acidobacteriota bacterium]
MKKVFLLLLICILSSQCGYHLRGTGSSLPPHIKKINVPMFKNLTTRFELDLKLTQKVIDEIVSRGKVEITTEASSSDAILIGEILSFTTNPIAFSGEATADRYNITIVAKIILRDLVSRKVVFMNPNFVYQQEYEVPEGTDFEAVESEAIDKVAEKFARSLVITILEGF